MIDQAKLARLRYQNESDLDAVRSLSERLLQAGLAVRQTRREAIERTVFSDSMLTAAELLAIHTTSFTPPRLAALRESVAASHRVSHLRAEWQKASAARTAAGPFYAALEEYATTATNRAAAADATPVPTAAINANALMTANPR